MSNENRPDDMFQNLKDGFSDFGKKVSSFMDDVLGSEGSGSEVQVRSDVYTEKGLYTIELELPGVNKQDVNIQIHEGVLSVKGQKEFPTGVENRNYDKKERQFGSFFRTFNLPLDVELDNIKAKYESGVLTIKLNRPHAANSEDESDVTIE
ncbi:MAG: Hsp20/alpha crystallin family protein [Bacteroidota bacterium]